MRKEVRGWVAFDKVTHKVLTRYRGVPELTDDPRYVEPLFQAQVDILVNLYNKSQDNQTDFEIKPVVKTVELAVIEY